MFWFRDRHAERLAAIETSVNIIETTLGIVRANVQITRNGVNQMAENLMELAQQTKERADRIDAKGDAILNEFRGVKDKLAEALAKLDEVGSVDDAKAVLRASIDTMDSQLQQFDAALVEEPPVDPVG